jgi:hypothetical protein
MNTKSFLQWSLVCLIFLFLIGLTGCADLRRLTMTQDELRLFGSWTVSNCLDPDVVCIHE